MIRTAKIGVCGVCGHEWLPAKTKANPTADPRKVGRCPSCKSRKWNDDDPDVQARKARPKDQPITDSQRAKARKNIALRRKFKKDKEALLAEESKPMATSGARCKHRIVAANCPICRGGA